MSSYDQNAAQDAGYAAGAVGKLLHLGRLHWCPQLFLLHPVSASTLRKRLIHVAEGDYDRAGQDVGRDEQAVENVPNDVSQGVGDAVQGIKNAPSDLGNAVESAASWVGDKIGGVEGEGRRAEGDAQQLDQNVDNSYNQGENQGRQQGW